MCPALAGLEATLRGEVPEFKLEYPCHSTEQNRWFHMSATPSNVDGGALVAHTDITDRVLAERRLQESEAHYRAIIENELDIVTILDENAIIKFDSPATQRILGYSPEELIGRDVFEFIHPDDVPTVRRELGSVLASSDPSKPVEFRFKHKKSGWRVVESIARNLLVNPWVNGVIVNSRDVTDRRETEAALREQEGALKLSHERLQALSGRLLETEIGNAAGYPESCMRSKSETCSIGGGHGRLAEFASGRAPGKSRLRVFGNSVSHR